ncbi:motility quorum-sensing regulator/GCU-specific mRNA interferase toxin [Pseudomonas synxantha]|uniref:Motility quorum-sensing regulator/GCU-specific mRNA interferase toxin n=2 Tax=Pseudomonas synxantha TaxID=47883 RepID=A0ACC6JFI1_9PSED|nr:motility quorum-sensing regulator/GCU-specific mRNA interferase toxin [Pseudomonas synxantha]
MRQGAKAFTASAMSSGKRMGLNLQDMQQAICSLDRRMLYKSMTCYTDHRNWQDVYHTRLHDLELYIKVTYCPNGGPPVISFKEKSL